VEKSLDFVGCYPLGLGWCQDNGNRAYQESKFGFLTTCQCLVKIDEGLGCRVVPAEGENWMAGSL